MSDPLSIAAGVVGVITAAAQISLLLTKFTKSTIAAPQQAKVVITEVSDISVILSQLQSYLLGLESPNSSRTSLLKVEQVVTIVSGCVLTFSELEKLLDELKTEDFNVLDCLKWARKESAIVALIQRLQNHKGSLSLVLNILNGFLHYCQVLLPAWLLRFARHTITEAKNSVGRLHKLMERCYSEMSSRVQALEVLNLQKHNASWTSKDDTESLATIRAHLPDLSEEIMESGLEHFEFLDELQRSRVYKRNQAFRKSVISALTDSVYSPGWSFFSDLSMAEVSNISVIDLAVIEGEVFNARRSSQTWSAQSGQGVSSDDHLDGQSTQLYKIAHTAAKSLPDSFSFTQTTPIGTSQNHPQWKERLKDEESTRNAENLDPKSTVSPADLSDALSPSQAPTTSSPQPPGGVLDVAEYGFFESPMEQDEAAYPCSGCGEILEERPAFELAGNRWHIDCFHCDTYRIIPKTHSGRHLLGDKSLDCVSCTDSCRAYKNKIEDLAIVIWGQAFCPTSFKCRSCKTKIEARNYTKTAQGIFCQKCYESLIRRHRSKASAENKQPEQTIPKSPKKVQNQNDKGLPALPLDKAVTLASAMSAPNILASPSMNSFESRTEEDIQRQIQGTQASDKDG